jgi:nitrate reductase gamma subunit
VSVSLSVYSFVCLSFCLVGKQTNHLERKSSWRDGSRSVLKEKNIKILKDE